MTPPTADRYYVRETWDIESWVDIIAVEYESLVEAYPFSEAFRSLPGTGPIDLLDVGCGTAIFPTYLDMVLPPDVRLRADLWDVSEASLIKARLVLAELEHFSVGETRQALIEDIPKGLPHRARYDVIWAIHSFTTVDRNRMPGVYERLLRALDDGGYLFVYQLTADSSYQKLHRLYRAEHPHGRERAPYMEFEDSTRILDSLGVKHAVYPLRFDHAVPAADPQALERYLRKCVLDDSIHATEFFRPLLEQFHDPDGDRYVVPQSVNLIEVRR